MTDDADTGKNTDETQDQEPATEKQILGTVILETDGSTLQWRTNVNGFQLAGMLRAVLTRVEENNAQPSVSVVEPAPEEAPPVE